MANSSKTHNISETSGMSGITMGTVSEAILAKLSYAQLADRFVGNWTLQNCENYAAYLTAIGFDEESRRKWTANHPTIEFIIAEGGKRWTIIWRAGDVSQSTDIDFEDTTDNNVEITIDGREMHVCIFHFQIFYLHSHIW